MIQECWGQGTTQMQNKLGTPRLQQSHLSSTPFRYTVRYTPILRPNAKVLESPHISRAPQMKPIRNPRPPVSLQTPKYSRPCPKDKMCPRRKLRKGLDKLRFCRRLEEFYVPVTETCELLRGLEDMACSWEEGVVAGVAGDAVREGGFDGFAGFSDDGGACVCGERAYLSQNSGQCKLMKPNIRGCLTVSPQTFQGKLKNEGAVAGGRTLIFRYAPRCNNSWLAKNF